MGGGICKVVETVGHGLNGYRFKRLFRQHLLSSPSPTPSPAVSRWSWSLCLVFQIWQKLRYLRAASVCMLELCAGIVCPYRYRDWCGQASSVETTSGSNFQVCCKVRWKMRKKTWEMMLVLPMSVFTCLRCLRQVWQLNGTFYVQQHQHQFSCLVFRLGRLKCVHGSDFPLVSGTRMYLISRLSTMLMRKVLSLRGTLALSEVFSRSDWVYWYGQLY